MTDDWHELEYRDYEEMMREEERRNLTLAGIARQNSMLLRRYRNFRIVADIVVRAWLRHPDVAAISLVGSVARKPWKEVPRFQPYRRERIELWHECGDLDLAVWLSGTRDLNALRKAKVKAVSSFRDELGGGVASHQVEAFMLDFQTSKFLGRLCEFNRCPKPGKRECLVPGCGSPRFLQQVRGFRWRRETIAKDRSVRLFDRSTGFLRRAASLPLPRTDNESHHADSPPINSA